LRALLPACAYQIIAHILLFFDIFHSLKKIAKKDKPETASITALPGLSFFFFVFIIFLGKEGQRDMMFVFSLNLNGKFCSQ